MVTHSLMEDRADERWRKRACRDARVREAKLQAESGDNILLLNMMKPNLPKALVGVLSRADVVVIVVVHRSARWYVLQ